MHTLVRILVQGCIS